MFVAQEKYQSNIAEYLLYMWQIEQIVRGAQFNLETIEQTVIAQMGLDDNQREQELAWYKELMQKMKKQQIVSSGHLMELKDLVVELSYLHNSLLKNVRDANYGFVYNSARPFIDELKEKQENKYPDDIEACLNALYAFWMLKASRKEISANTEQAMGAVSKLIALLSAKYKEMMGAVQ